MRSRAATGDFLLIVRGEDVPPSRDRGARCFLCGLLGDPSGDITRFDRMPVLMVSGGPVRLGIFISGRGDCIDAKLIAQVSLCAILARGDIQRSLSANVSILFSMAG